MYICPTSLQYMIVYLGISSYILIMQASWIVYTIIIYEICMKFLISYIYTLTMHKKSCTSLLINKEKVLSIL